MVVPPTTRLNAASTPWTSRLRVLVIDDDVETQSFVRNALRSDADVTCCGTVIDGLGALEHGGFDVLVLDLVLPRRGGLELLRAHPIEHGLRRIVVLTGWWQGAILARRLGADETLAKPCPASVLRAAVLRGRNTPGPLAA
jgi:two-component system copper resistance phosphate regulon response regulator CusR